MNKKLNYKKSAFLITSVIIATFLLSACSKETAEKDTITIDTTEVSIDTSASLPPEENRVYTNSSEFFDTTGLLKKTQDKAKSIETTIEENGKSYQLEFVDPNDKNGSIDVYYKDISEFTTETD